mgnify:CR=1 FL=1
MAQPVLYIIPSFDAAVGANINFAYEGEQVFANELVIYDNETGSQVYSQKTEWMRTYHTINGSELQNGKYYYCKLRVFNKAGEPSSWSSQKSFRCFTTPQFGFSNVATGQIVQSSELNVKLSYSQAENEPLNTYTVGLYNANHVLVRKSDTRYGVDLLEYTLKNLEDGTQYYLRAIGDTLNGMTADTGFVPFSVKFITPNYWTYVDLSDNHDGTVRVSCNIRTVTGRYEGDGDPLYIRDNHMIDISKPGQRVVFDDGFTIQGDFTIKLLGYGFTAGETFLELKDHSNNRITLTYREGWYKPGTTMAADRVADDSVMGAKIGYVDMRCEGVFGVVTYTIHSNAMPKLADGEEYLIQLRRIGEFCELKVEKRNIEAMTAALEE